MMLLIPRLLILVFLLLFGTYLWLIRGLLLVPPGQWLLAYALVATGFAMTGGLFHILYAFSLMYGIVPKLDPIVDPSTHQHLQRHGDYLLHRLHRMLFYACSAGWRLFNRRLMPGYDFRQLPRNIRVLLMVYFYVLITFMMAGITGYGAFKLLDVLGYS